MDNRVPYRDIRQQLLKDLSFARFKKETAEAYGTPSEVKEYATEIQSIELELKILSIRK